MTECSVLILLKNGSKSLTGSVRREECVFSSHCATSIGGEVNRRFNTFKDHSRASLYLNVSFSLDCYVSRGESRHTGTIIQCQLTENPYLLDICRSQPIWNSSPLIDDISADYMTYRHTTLFELVNSKRFGFNVASGAQCDIPINCAIEILLLTN